MTYPSQLTAVLHSATAVLHSTTATTVAKAANKSSGSILDPIAKPIAWVLAEIYSVVPNYGVAIMILSVIWMALISPLTLKSTRSMLAMQKLQPQLKALQAKHKDDRQAFAQAQMELFREHQVSPFGACLPMLLPMPVFFALFRVIDGLSHTVKASGNSLVGCTAGVCPEPKYLNHTTRMFQDIVASHGHIVAFGMDLSKNAFSAHSGFLAALPFWLALLVMGATSYFQSAQMMSRNTAAQNNPQMKMMKYIPLVFVVVCARFPAGVIIYYSMSNLCRIFQQDAMYRYDPRVKALVAMEVAEVEELTHEIDEGRSGKGGTGGDKSGGVATPKRPSGNVGGAGNRGGGKVAGSGTSGAGGGRSRFRDLLAAAQEQQGKNPKSPPPKGRQDGGSTAKGSGAGGNGKGSNGKGSNGKVTGGGGGSTNGSTNGSTPNGSSANGRSGAPGGRSRPANQPRPGGRTNRKKRGR